MGRVYGSMEPVSFWSLSFSLIFPRSPIPSNEVGKMLARAIGFAALALLITPANAQELTVYTALEADQVKAYQASFEKSNPGIKIRWVRDSTGIVTAKLLAE